jgi:hypothetical protein
VSWGQLSFDSNCLKRQGVENSLKSVVPLLFYLTDGLQLVREQGEYLSERRGIITTSAESNQEKASRKEASTEG